MASESVTLFRWTRDDYARAVAAGVFAGRRVELLGGELLEMVPEGPLHAAVVGVIASCLRAVLPRGGFHVREAHPLALGSRGEPEPDIVVVRGQYQDYQREHPTPGDCLLAIEVSDTSLAFDRGRKADEYAAAAIADYWVVALAERHVETFGEPAPSGDSPTGWRYQRQAVYLPGAVLLPPVPGARPLAVAEMLPWPEPMSTNW